MRAKLLLMIPCLFVPGIANGQFFCHAPRCYEVPCCQSYECVVDCDPCSECGPSKTVTVMDDCGCRQYAVQEMKSEGYEVSNPGTIGKFSAFGGTGGLYGVNTETGAMFRYDDKEKKWTNFDPIPQQPLP
jgi:hypothetical protein